MHRNSIVRKTVKHYWNGKIKPATFPRKSQGAQLNVYMALEIKKRLCVWSYVIVSWLLVEANRSFIWRIATKRTFRPSTTSLMSRCALCRMHWPALRLQHSWSSGRGIWRHLPQWHHVGVSLSPASDGGGSTRGQHFPRLWVHFQSTFYIGKQFRPGDGGRSLSFRVQFQGTFYIRKLVYR